MDVEVSMATVCLVVIATTLCTYQFLMKRNHRYPSGPFSLPMAGNLLQLIQAGGSAAKFMETCREKFGDVFTLETGGSKRVVVSGYETMQELLVRNAEHTSNRSTRSMSRSLQEYVREGTPGLLWASHPQWKILRSFAISKLKEKGMGQAAMEPQILEEVGEYINHFIQPHINQPVDVALSLAQAACNTISQMLLGKRFDYNDQLHSEMVAALHDASQFTLQTAMIGNLPFGKHLNKWLSKRENSARKTTLWPTLQMYIDEQKETLDDANPQNIIDRFLTHAISAKEDEKKCFSEANAKVFAYHIYMAGTEATATSLRWALLYSCLYPEVKEKVQLEIEKQIGPDRVVTCRDRLSMPYTDAVLYETLRKANIASFALPHTLEKDLVVKGVLIPSGADLMLNMASVLHDEQVYEDPHKFKPERYLTGNIAVKKQHTIPFGLGRRACLGKSLAKMEMFLFYVTLLQKYDICLAEGEEVTDIPVESLASEPMPFKLIFTPR
ncbi:cytochrome P450 2C23-like [Watersipora subatra]|uniref:cytochrome P450 2C23-like n=1 Tax=Watersipora subatra TaxID=2589382 RepID=UPI00355BDD16